MLRICHVDFASPNVQATVSFLQETFGWTCNVTKMPNGDEYHGLTNKGMFGGVTELKPGMTKPSAVPYIWVSKIEDYSVKVEKAGGKITSPLIETPHGRWQFFTTSDGKLTTALYDNPTVPADAESQETISKNIVWWELFHPNIDEVEKLFGEVFGWKGFPFEHMPSYRMIGVTSEKDCFGAFVKGDEAYWLPTAPVGDVDGTAEKAKKKGKITEQPHDQENVGRLCRFMDEAGVEIGCIHPTMPADGASAETTTKRAAESDDQESSSKRLKKIRHIPVHYDLASSDKDKTIKFLADLLGFTTQKYPMPDGSEYHGISSSHGMFGGVTDLPKGVTTSCGIPYIQVGDVNETRKQLEAEGAKVHGDLVDTPYGRWYFLSAPDVSVFAIHDSEKPTEESKILASVGWLETCEDNNSEHVLKMFGKVFEWETRDDIMKGSQFLCIKGEPNTKCFGSVGIKYGSEKNHFWVPYLNCEDVRTVAPNVEKFGGKLLSDFLPTPNGEYIVCVDPTGMKFGLSSRKKN